MGWASASSSDTSASVRSPLATSLVVRVGRADARETVPMVDHTIVLIGPAAVGKSTVGAEVAARLGRPFVDLDEVAGPYYEEIGQPVTWLIQRIEAAGLCGGHRAWQRARAHAVVRCVEDHAGSVIALGAGHSHFEDQEHFERVARALVGTYVVLLRPDADEQASETFLSERCRAERGEDRGGEGFLGEWVRSDHNRRLEWAVVDVAHRSPADLAAEVIGLVADV